MAFWNRLTGSLRNGFLPPVPLLLPMMLPLLVCLWAAQAGELGALVGLAALNNDLLAVPVPGSGDYLVSLPRV